MAHAVNLIGKAMFGKPWSHYDPAAKRFHSLSHDRLHVMDTVERVKKVRDSLYFDKQFSLDDLPHESEWYRERYSVPGHDQHDRLDDFAVAELPMDLSSLYDEDAWEELYAHSVEMQDNSYAQCGRWEEVRRRLAKYILRGDLEYYLNNPYNGSMENGDPLRFNTDSWKKPFEMCTIPIGEYYDDITHYRLFLNETQFLQLPEMRGGQSGGVAEMWHPDQSESGEKWCRRSEPRQEANRRAKLVFGPNPTQKQEAQALATMWLEAKGEKLSVDTFEQYLIRARKGKMESVAG